MYGKCNAGFNLKRYCKLKDQFLLVKSVTVPRKCESGGLTGEKNETGIVIVLAAARDAIACLRTLLLLILLFKVSKFC